MPTTSLLLALCATVGFATGWTANGWRLGAELAELRREHADSAREVAEAATRRLIDARLRGDALQTRLAAAEAARDTALQETQHAIRRLTTGRPCLGGDVVRLLNQSTGSSAKPAGVPEAPGEPDRADAAVATDTDVALWAAHARRSYDACRGRLEAIDGFYQGENE